MNAAGGIMNSVEQNQTSTNPFINVTGNTGTNNQQSTQNGATQNVDPTERLLQMKKLLDAGAISQEEYDKVKAQVLGF